MAYVEPSNRTAGEFIDAPDWNQDVVSNVSFLANPPACRVHDASGTQTLNNNTATAIDFDSERFDTDNMHSTSSNISRITINTAGLYVVGAHISVTGETDYTSLVADLRVSGTTLIARDRILTAGTYSASEPHLFVVTLYKFTATQYVELVVTQENTSANAEATVISGNLTPEFWATWIGLG